MNPKPLATKRLLDVVLALCGLIAAAPVLLVIAVAIRLSMGSPVLFRQTRPGLHGQPFELVKFRTMRDPTDAQGNVIETRQRVTRVGSILRRTSLDEIPELYNVLRGEMSIVGPRPLLMEFMQYYNATQRRRHDMRPGMTGWAQVHGRRTVQMQERIALDVWYVDNWSLRLDAHIMLTTIGQILRGQGAEPTRGVPVAELGWTPDTNADADKESQEMIEDALT
jgi:lipopolysaccharide/colanic/teichoic acid biosynthesis glycosyltransferase